FDPTTNQWRTLTPPPTTRTGRTIGEAWTGTEMLVIAQIANPQQEQQPILALLSYDPATDRWAQRAAPPPTGDATTTWAGNQLVIWSDSQGSTFDPATNTWSDLPETPADHPVERASVAWIND